MNRLVFVHGRAQEHKDAAALKQEWIDAFTEGLGKSSLELPIPELHIRFPYYGQTLFDLASGAADVADVVIRGAAGDRPQLQFQQAVLQEVQRSVGITDAQVENELGRDVVARGPLNWQWLQGILRAIDRHVPGGSGAGIALATADVYHYLRNPGVRDTIEEGIRAAFTPGDPTVVVAHSLGTVVAFNLLRREGADQGWVVPLFLTLGSPLAVGAIKSSLSPIAHPSCVTRWYNAMDERDVVALYPLDNRHFDIDPAIENQIDVRNRTSNRHGIAGYLDDKTAARRIYDALIG